MRITIVTSPFGCLPPTGIGAVEKRWFYVGEEFARAGHEVTFLCKTPPAATPAATSSVRYQHIPGHNRTGSLVADLLLDLLYSLRAMRALQSCDILVLNTFWSPFLCLVARGKFRKSVYNVARFPKWHFRFFPPVDRLACVSRAIASAVQGLVPYSPQRIAVIPNPVNTTAFRPLPRREKDDATVLCFSGRVHPEKGLTLLVSAYAELRDRYPNLMLTIIGPQSISLGGGGHSYVTHLESLAAGAPIHWVEPIADPACLAEEIARCDIYCYPSVAEQGESFGVAPLEAMATERPVIVSSLQCFADFVQPGVTGLVFDHRAADAHLRLAESISSLIDDEPLATRISHAGAELARSQFSVAGIAQQYLDDFAKLLGS